MVASLFRDAHTVKGSARMMGLSEVLAVAHSAEDLLAGTGGMKLLAYGTREPNDIAWYPRSKKVYFRGVGLMTRLPELDYWEGE